MYGLGNIDLQKYAEKVVKCGIDSVEWEKPMNNLFKLFAQVIT